MSTPRARRRAQTRQLILDTASELIAEHGLDWLTMAQLARAVDYTPGALYRYFDSKNALFVALQLDVLARYQGLVEAAHARVPDDLPADRRALLHVLVTGEVYAQAARRRPTWFALVANNLGNPRMLLSDEEAAPLLPPLLQFLQTAARPFQQAAETGALGSGEPLQRAITLLSALQGVLQIRKLERLQDVLRADRTAQQLLHTLVRGWGASEPLLQAALSDLARIESSTPLVPEGASS